MNPVHSQSKFFLKACLPFVVGAIVLRGPLPRADATGGPFYPERWLDAGGVASEAAPEFFWGDELRRWAFEFRPAEKRQPAESVVSAPEPFSVWHESVRDLEKVRSTTGEADGRDFEEALRTGRLRVPDPGWARAAHDKARARLKQAGTVADLARIPPEERTQPDGPTMEEVLGGEWEETPSEFADYHAGARAFLRGSDQYPQARAAWEALLARPPGERHHRTVWAAFMLGKLALKTGAYLEALDWFRKTRETAADGFGDSIGLAADSYGWEARAQLKLEAFEEAARLYLTQLSLGDISAINSLKQIVPDRQDPFAAEPVVNPNEGKQLRSAARSPLLRKLVTLHVLAVATRRQGLFVEGEIVQPNQRSVKWLKELETQKITDAAEVQYLGWLAYTAGRYDEAARWLALAHPELPSSLWLRAKLERRTGRLPEAAKLMASVFERLRAAETNGADSSGKPGPTLFQLSEAAGDLAGLRLSRAEFVSAMDCLFKGKMWADAAYLGDFVLTVGELQSFVESHVPKPLPGDVVPGPQDESDDKGIWLRGLLGRRLVRNGRHAEALEYIEASQRPLLQRYMAELQRFDDPKLAGKQRARSGFNAAWIARHFGMELMGSFMEPDGFASGGAFEPGFLDVERGKGLTLEPVFSDRGVQYREVPVKLWIPSTPEERSRVGAHAPVPNKRFHYRYVAADLAWDAAKLLPNGAEELADVLNTAGNWLKVRDESAAKRFYEALERRCPKTAIGRAALKKHWFVGDATGPWSTLLLDELPPPK